jgi:hypothetical protein
MNDEPPATLKITRGRFERQRRPPYRDHRATIAMANVKRTFWSPNWSRTRDHGSVLNGTDRHARLIFRNTNQHFEGQNEMGRNGHQQILS